MFADWLIGVLGVYCAAGCVFAIAFSAVGVKRTDAAARNDCWGFRALILPGAAALWPALLLKWWRAAR